jgi:hypothetical protein
VSNKLLPLLWRQAVNHRPASHRRTQTSADFQSTRYGLGTLRGGEKYRFVGTSEQIVSEASLLEEFCSEALFRVVCRKRDKWRRSGRPGQ